MQTTTRSAASPSERGAALLVVVVIAVLMGGLALAFTTENISETRVVKGQWDSLVAREIAEAGLAMAEAEIRGLADPDGDGVGTLMCPYAGGLAEVTATPHPDVADRWTLTAVGSFGEARRRLEVGVRWRSRQRHVEGLYSKETLVVNGDVQTDGYDSRISSYATQASNLDDNGAWYALPSGHVGSGEDIAISGTSVGIRGSAIPGPTYTVQNTAGALITGDHLPRQHPVWVPDPSLTEFEQAFASNDNDWLGGTEAFGADEVELANIHDPELAGLSGSQIDALPKADMMALGDDAVGALRFDELLQEVYADLVDIDAVALERTIESNYKYYLEVPAKLYEGTVNLAPIDVDDSGSYVPTEGTTEATEGGVATNPTVLPPPGRVSYDPTTRELRASAGAAVVLDGGTYAFSDLRLVGGAYLVVRRPSTIYVTGRLDLSGGAILNESGAPSDLRIVVHPYPLPSGHTPSQSYVKIRGGSVVSASLYAPGVEVSVGGTGDFFGSIVGKKISLLGSVSYHYDEALDTTQGTGADFELLYWRELARHSR